MLAELKKNIQFNKLQDSVCRTLDFGFILLKQTYDW